MCTVLVAGELETIKKAAEQGDVEAQLKLGTMYAQGEGVPEDDTKAVYWFHQAAEQGFVKAQLYLGIMYDNGLGVAEDVTKAVHWYRLAAEQGNAEAQFELGYRETPRHSSNSGRRRGTVTCMTKATGCLKTRPRPCAGIAWPPSRETCEAQFELGYRYNRGEGVTEDDAEALRWYRLAAEQGSARAQFSLGVMYDCGEGVTIDDAEALRWYPFGSQARKML